MREGFLSAKEMVPTESRSFRAAFFFLKAGLIVGDLLMKNEETQERGQQRKFAFYF